MTEHRVFADAEQPRAFGAARRLLRRLLEPALEARPEFAADLGPELAALLPERRGDPRVPELSQIALGGTKRRLHGDSERLFRMVGAFASVVGAGLAAGDSIAIDNAEYCDRSSLACLLHLVRTAPAPPRLILATSSAAARPHWPWMPSSNDPAAWTDAESQQAELLRRFVAETQATLVVVEGPVVRTAQPVAELVLAAADLKRGEAARGARRALRLAQRSFGFTLHYELILLCCRVALASGVPEARTPALEFAGLAHAYLGRNDLAAEILEAAHAAARTPEVGAQTAYYLGLLTAKREGRLDDGRDWFDRGMRAIEGQAGLAAAVERGWLRNGLAFTAWTGGRYAEAREFVKRALAESAGCPGAQATNLRVNLTNNLSVLLEQSGDAAGALEVWRTLGPWETFVRGGTFGKSYRYREAWLLLTLNRPDEAYTCARRSLKVAREHRDVFHTRLIGAACRYLAARIGDLDASAYWAEEEVDLAAGLGHRAALAHACGQLAHVYYQAGDRSAALAMLDHGARIAARTGSASTWSGAAAPAVLAAAARELRSGAGPERLGPDDALLGVALERPKPKLATPFPLANLASDASYAPATHELALGTVRGRRRQS